MVASALMESLSIPASALAGGQAQPVKILHVLAAATSLKVIC